MPDLAVSPHPSALEFQGLAEHVVATTPVPGPETQVYEQEPDNGLYYRKSGRLLTSESHGELIDRARSGADAGVLFELQRRGSVARGAASILTRRRVNPVHQLDEIMQNNFVSIRWIDEEGMHEAIPTYQNGQPRTIAVLSWIGDTIRGRDFAHNPSAATDRKVRSVDTEDPAVELFERAATAYRKIRASSQPTA